MPCSGVSRNWSGIRGSTDREMFGRTVLTTICFWCCFSSPGTRPPIELCPESTDVRTRSTSLQVKLVQTNSAVRWNAKTEGPAAGWFRTWFLAEGIARFRKLISIRHLRDRVGNLVLKALW